MEIISITLLLIICIFSLLNLIILVYLASFLVRLRGFVEEVIEVMTGMEDEKSKTVPVELAKTPRSKTWDEKYEEELNVFNRKVKEEQEQGRSGLVDLE